MRCVIERKFVEGFDLKTCKNMQVVQDVQVMVAKLTLSWQLLLMSTHLKSSLDQRTRKRASTALRRRSMSAPATTDLLTMLRL